MRSEFSYSRPEVLEEALALLDRNKPTARISAGMTDLMSEIKEGKLAPSILIDISRLSKLRFIEDAGEAVRIGPLVTHTELAESELVKKHIPLLGRAAGHVGSPQIRNVGTIGGNIGNASPCADTLPALTTMGANVVIEGGGGKKVMPITDFIIGPYRTILSANEMITEISVPKKDPNWQAVYFKLARRKALAPSRLSLAVQGRSEKGTVSAIRISVGACTPTPSRSREAEGFLEGRKPTSQNLMRAARLTTQEVLQRTGPRHSAIYKKPVMEALMFNALKEMFR